MPKPTQKRKNPLESQPQNHKRTLPTLRPIKKKKTTTTTTTNTNTATTTIGTDTADDTLPGAPALVIEPKINYVRFEGSRNFRHRIVYATLANKPITITNIRTDTDATTGLADYEIVLLRMIESISSGASIIINDTGTSVKYVPGLLIGGDVLGLSLDCPLSRAIGYYIEPLLLLAPFVKHPITMRLTGITNNDTDISVDILRTVTLPLLKNFHSDLVPTIKVRKRGFAPLGGGEVDFFCPIVKSLQSVSLIDDGKIKRIRGLSLACRVSAQFSNRMIESAKGKLLKLLPDIHVYSEHVKGRDTGLSPGFAISLVAETTTGARLCAEDIGRVSDSASVSGSDSGSVDPVSVGEQCATRLLLEISKGGYIDSLHQPLALSLAALTPESASRLRLGKLTSHAIQCLRLLQEFFGVTFQLTPEEATGTVLASNMGIGFININRKTD